MWCRCGLSFGLAHLIGHRIDDTSDLDDVVRHIIAPADCPVEHLGQYVLSILVRRPA
jgi:hypothetical protein